MKIDTTDEELAKLADEEAVTVLPTFKFYKDGKEVSFDACGGGHSLRLPLVLQGCSVTLCAISKEGCTCNV